MDKIVITIGIFSYIIGILLMSKNKKGISNEAIVEYEKNIKPKFFKFFLLALTPMLIVMYALLSDNLEILNYFLVLIFLSLCLDMLAFYRLWNAIRVSDYKTELSQFQIYFGTVIFGKIVTLIGLKLVLEQLISPSI